MEIMQGKTAVGITHPGVSDPRGWERPLASGSGSNRWVWRVKHQLGLCFIPALSLVSCCGCGWISPGRDFRRCLPELVENPGISGCGVSICARPSITLDVGPFPGITLDAAWKPLWDSWMGAAIQEEHWESRNPGMGWVGRDI